MTANVMKEDIERVYRAGMDGHIAKPLDVSEMYAVMQKLLFREAR
jgi:CheY-like chemotaxis protein